MKIQDKHAKHLNNGSVDVIEMPSGGIEVLADDGTPLYEITQNGNELVIRAGHFCKNKEVALDEMLAVMPNATNSIRVTRTEYKKRVG